MNRADIKSLVMSLLRGMTFMVGLLTTGLLAYTLKNGLYDFAPNDRISSSQINDNFQTLNTKIDANTAKLVPVGTILAWHKSFSGTPTLGGDWAECNGQVLSDSESPYDGQTLPNLNNAMNAWNAGGQYLRGGATSGSLQADTFQGHYHWRRTDHQNERSIQWTASGGSYVFIAGVNEFIDHTPTTTAEPASDGTNGAPRTGNETRPASMSVVWIIKIK